MNDVIERIVTSGTEPTRQDIADLLASIGPPGERQAEKLAAVKELYDVTGHRHQNSQGHSVIDTLESWEQY